ncbi:MAG: amidohydrolase [Vicinamibacterales bacterium]
MSWRLAAAASAACLAVACGGAVPAPGPPPDRVYLNARIWTGDPSTPAASAMAVAGGAIVAVGTDEAIEALAGEGTTLVDLGGRRVVPGFNDAHWHLPSRRTAELAGAGSVDAILARLRDFAGTLPAEAWITGRGWGPSDFPALQAHRRYLDAAFPDRPVLLTDRDGHQALANGRALALAGVTRGTPDPVNGRIERDPSGEPTGLLKEAAAGLVRRMLPPPGVDEIHAALLAEMRKAAAFGLTALQVASPTDPGSDEWAAYERARAAGELIVRLRVAVPFDRDPTPERLAALAAFSAAHQGPLLRSGIAKGMLDGTVDAHTAAMLEPYAGTSDSGLPMWTADALDRAVAAYDAAGLQVELHAIGDRAIRMALDAYEHAARANGTTGRRHRVEHAEVPALDDIPRFAALGVIASTQAMFATPDTITLTNYAPTLGPARASHANAFRLFDEAGAVQAFGSDYPVFTMQVMRGLLTAVTRETPEGTPAGGWYPEHRLSLDAALRHFTRDAAFAAFEEDLTGTLAAGRAADFVVLSEDIFDDPPRRLRTAAPVLTVMGGRETYRAPAFTAGAVPAGVASFRCPPVFHFLGTDLHTSVAGTPSARRAWTGVNPAVAGRWR